MKKPKKIRLLTSLKFGGGTGGIHLAKTIWESPFPPEIGEMIKTQIKEPWKKLYEVLEYFPDEELSPVIKSPINEVKESKKGRIPK